MARSRFVLAAILVALAGCGRAENSLLLLDALPDVASITVEGNRRFDDGTLTALMTLREGSWWNPFREHKYRKGQLTTDIRAILTFYMRHGYLRAREVNRQVVHSGDEVHITIGIEEGEPVQVQDVVIQGARAMNPNQLQRSLALKAGAPMDPFKLQDDHRLILRTLAEMGYWEAEVLANVQLFENEALVFYVLQEGSPVAARDVQVQGMREVRARLAHREISVRPGELLRLDDLVKSQTRLLQSSYFADAQWDTSALDTTAHEVSVSFRVRERKLHWFESGIGVSSQEVVRFTGEWGSRNFLGSGMRLALQSGTDFDFTDRLPTVLDEHRSEVILNLSHLLGTRWEGQPNAFYLYDREFIQNLNAGFEQNILGLGFSARRRFGDLRNQVVLSLENRWVYNDADSAARESDIQLERDAYQTRLITARLERDSRNDFFNPTRGGREYVRIEAAGGVLGGNNGFRKGTVGVVGFRPTPIGSWGLAGRIELGLIKPSSGASDPEGIPVANRIELVPTEDRFFLGGANSVRGFDHDELDGTLVGDPALGQAEGGLAKILMNLEVRLPLFWRFSGVGFLDAGNVWQDRTRINLDRFVPHRDPEEVSHLDVRYAYGLGIRLQTPVGPVRLDYARKWNVPKASGEGKERWHVALGHAF